MIWGWWVVPRLMASVGSWYVWKRVRSRRAWMWILLLQVASVIVGLLCFRIHLPLAR